MFLHLLNETEQKLFWRAAHHVVYADERLHARESALQEAFARELDVNELPRAGDLAGLERDLAAVRHPREANIFLLELAGTAWVDGELHPAERALLSRFGNALSVSEDKSRRLLEVASRLRELNDEARILVLEGDPA